eukprot:scpid60772/ scgid15509/ Acetyl-coenzyme A transporter 1; Solute carrier family 33 member 1
MSSTGVLRSRNPEDSQSQAGGDATSGSSMDSNAQTGLLAGDNPNEGQQHDVEQEANWRTNKSSIALLVFLYVLQGIPLGLAGSIPLILQQRNISYKGQATFSLVFWPFSLKLLWAPFVDGIYSRRMGRRKSWLVPTQYAIALLMIWLSFIVTHLIGDGESSVPQLVPLTGVFFALNMLAATQDIAVDGWALTMLDRRNVGYASTCNSVGQTAGYFLGNVVFLALESADFCNSYLRFEPSPTGIVTLDSFLLFWGFVFLVTTSLVWAFKAEKKELLLARRQSSDSEERGGDCDTVTRQLQGTEWTTEEYVQPEEADAPGILSSYRQLFYILKLKNIQSYILCTLFIKLGMSVADSMTGLKLIEYGVPKEKLAMLGVPVVPLQIVLPLIISRYTAGPRPLTVYMYAYVPRLLFGFVFAALIWWTRSFGQQNGAGHFPGYFYVAVVALYALHQVTVYSMFVAIMAWHSRISDPRVGGTYMTLLNTISNLAANWPGIVAMWFVDMLTVRECRSKESSQVLDAACPTANSEACKTAGGNCFALSDGYFYEMVISICLGAVWLYYFGKKLYSLQLANLSSWRLPSNLGQS